MAQSTDTAQRYDPTHDPLVAPGPGQGQAYAPTWWVASASAPPEDDGPVRQDMDVDVAIIGSGATGLSAALYLAQEEVPPDEQEDSKISMELRTQIKRLRSKLEQIAGAAALAKFD